MPLFLYHCESCDNTFEVLQKMNDDTPHCTKCDSNKVTRQVGQMSFVLKGEGWSKTGYCKTPTPINTDSKGSMAGFAHVADRNSGKSLGYVPTGVANI